MRLLEVLQYLTLAIVFIKFYKYYLNVNFVTDKNVAFVRAFVSTNITVEIGFVSCLLCRR